MLLYHYRCLTCIGVDRLKKLTFNISLFVLVCLLVIVLFLIYIKPNEQLNLEANKIDVQEKITYMITNFKSEVILTEQDIDGLIKQNFNPQIGSHLVVDGAYFYIEKNILHAKLNVKYRNKVAAELNAQYSFELNDSGVVSIKPLSLQLKDINLPTTLLTPITFQLYDMKNSMVKITKIQNKNREIIVNWKISLFE